MFGKESSQRRLKTPLTELLLILQEIKHKTTETTKRRHATVILKFPHSTLRVYPAQATPPWYPSNHLATHPGPIHSGVWVIWLNVACLNHTCNISHDILVYYSIIEPYWSGDDSNHWHSWNVVGCRCTNHDEAKLLQTSLKLPPTEQLQRFGEIPDVCIL